MEESLNYTYETAPRYVHPWVWASAAGLVAVVIGFFVLKNK
jgi:hypothetical protein